VSYNHLRTNHLKHSGYYDSRNLHSAHSVRSYISCSLLVRINRDYFTIEHKPIGIFMETEFSVRY